MSPQAGVTAIYPGGGPQYQWAAMMVNSLAERWHLAQMRPNCAEMAQRNLARQRFSTFLPLERVTRRLGKQIVSSKRPYFPGYLFVGVDASSCPWRAIQSTQGISHLVRFGDKPAPVPLGMVAELQQSCDDEGCIRSAADFTAGDAVRIDQGSFAGLIGRVEQLAPEKRAWVLLDIMGKATRVSVSSADLRAERGSV